MLYVPMFARVLLSICAAVVLAAGVLLMDCAWAFLGTDPTDVCSTVQSLGISRMEFTGIGLALFAVLAFVAVWVPATRPGAKRRKRDPEHSLRRNIDRIGEVVAERPAPDATEKVVARLEALEASMAEGNSEASREATHQWMLLLREANELHNDGEIATEDFRRINTRLLDLFIEPASAASRLA